MLAELVTGGCMSTSRLPDQAADRRTTRSALRLPGAPSTTGGTTAVRRSRTPSGARWRSPSTGGRSSTRSSSATAPRPSARSAVEPLDPAWSHSTTRPGRRAPEQAGWVATTATGSGRTQGTPLRFTLMSSDALNRAVVEVVQAPARGRGGGVWSSSSDAPRPAPRPRLRTVFTSWVLDNFRSARRRWHSSTRAGRGAGSANRVVRESAGGRPDRVGIAGRTRGRPPSGATSRACWRSSRSRSCSVDELAAARRTVQNVRWTRATSWSASQAVAGRRRPSAHRMAHARLRDR